MQKKHSQYNLDKMSAKIVKYTLPSKIITVYG